MRPHLLKMDTRAAPVEREALHLLVCAFVEAEFKRKAGDLDPLFVVATGAQIVWLQAGWEDDREKRVTINAVRLTLAGTDAHAYSLVTQAFVASFDSRMSETERKHWLNFCRLHGVSALPPQLRDDIVMVMSHDRDGGIDVSRYLVTVRERGPNLLGPRIDEDQKLTGMAGQMFDLFHPAKPFPEVP